MLSDADIERYARQVVVPGIGAAGQERLMATTALVVGSARGAAQAARYLRAAGMTVVERGDGAATAQGDSTPAGVAVVDRGQGLSTAQEEGAPTGVVVVADAGAVPAAELARLAALGLPVCWYAAAGPRVDSGVHPASPLPPRAPACPEQSCVHDVAGAEVAALACAVVLGLGR